ncbi:MAG TPA: MFS transporter, partial [Verrucomicrobiae bacterium]|nr:MFS transporter [Verrucomicrobiae bacterium]
HGGRASPGILYAATILLAFFNSLDNPSRQALVPNLVPRETLARALALNSSQRYVAVIAGPSLAGVVLAAFGPQACYAVDALSWLYMVATLASIRTPPKKLKPTAAASDPAALAA